MRASQEAEEAEALRKQQELEAEDAVLRESMAEHESHEDQLAIIQAEEEQAILAAIRESEREAANAQPRTAAKGKQTRRSSSRLAGPTINSGDSPLIEGGCFSYLIDLNCLTYFTHRRRR